jgi:hypothetical protein
VRSGKSSVKGLSVAVAWDVHEQRWARGLVRVIVPKSVRKVRAWCPLVAKRGATGLAVCVHGQKGGSLPFHYTLLGSLQEGFGLCQGQPNLLNPLAVFLHDCDFLHGFLLTVIRTHTELHLELHGDLPPGRVIGIRLPSSTW